MEHGSGTFWLGRLGGWQVPLYEPKSHISYAVLKKEALSLCIYSSGILQSY